MIVDDFTISGGTLISLAKGLKERGVNKIYACLSHLLITETGLEKLENSLIDCIISTDSVYNQNLEKSNKIKIVSVAPLFAEAIVRIHNKESVSSIFDKIPEKISKWSVDII